MEDVNRGGNVKEIKKKNEKTVLILEDYILLEFVF